MSHVGDFSVLMSVYAKDNPSWFRAAVDSIMCQDTVPAELILVVDGPIENDLEKQIWECKNLYPSLRVVRLAENAGLGNALNVGLKHCSRELVARMDSDDIVLPGRFRKQLACFQKEPSLSIVGGQITEFLGHESNVISVRKVPTTDEEIKRYLRVRCPFNHMTVMFRKSHVEEAGGYLHWFYNEDYYLWIRMAEIGCKFANLDEPLVNVRVTEETYRRRGGVRYFASEIGLQAYMLRRGIINPVQFLGNVAIRFGVQILAPPRLRGWVYRRFARQRSLEIKY